MDHDQLDLEKADPIEESSESEHHLEVDVVEENEQANEMIVLEQHIIEEVQEVREVREEDEDSDPDNLDVGEEGPVGFYGNPTGPIELKNKGNAFF